MVEESGPAEIQQPLKSLGRRAAIVAAIVAALVGAFALGRTELEPPRMSSHAVEIKPSPNVLLAVHDMKRLEGTSYHMERVVELTDEQTHLWGLVTAKDALLLVAVGDVVAGVDLEKVGAGDVTTDWMKKSVRLKLPAPEVFSASLDSSKTHVYARSTDVLAERNEALEGQARANAEAMMKKAAVEAGILDRARRSTEKSLDALLRSLGFETVEIVW